MAAQGSQIPDVTVIGAAFGHSHWGMSMAPGTAELVADLLAESHRDSIPRSSTSPGSIDSGLSG